MSRFLNAARKLYFVTMHAARTNMSAALSWLASRPPEEILAKRRALRAVRAAFVTRRDATLAAPAARKFDLELG